jgi:hypothetical protein
VRLPERDQRTTALLLCNTNNKQARRSPPTSFKAPSPTCWELYIYDQENKGEYANFLVVPYHPSHMSSAPSSLLPENLSLTSGVLPIAAAGGVVLFLVFKSLFSSSSSSNSNKKYTSIPLPPGPKPIPVLGNAHQLPKGQEWLTYAKWGKVKMLFLALYIFDD